MKKYILPVVACILLAACGNADDSKKAANADNKEKFDSTNLQDDTKFAVAAADGGMLEVELGKLAQTNASSPVVKNFGQMMVDDHSKAGEELKTLAASKSITLPQVLSDKNQKDYSDLSKKKGEDFDKAYSSFMVKDHKEDIEEFKKEAQNGKDADIRAWASGKVPTLEHHLAMAQRADSASYIKP